MPTLTPYNKDGLQIVFSLNKVPDSNCLSINVTATNHNLSNMTEFLFQVAVPRVSIFLCFFVITKCRPDAYSICDVVAFKITMQ